MPGHDRADIDTECDQVTHQLGCVPAYATWRRRHELLDIDRDPQDITLQNRTSSRQLRSTR